MELKNMWIADFETTPYTQYLIDNYTRVWLYYVECLGNENHKLGLNISSFMKFIFSKDEDQRIYFHNLSFDGEFILHYLIDEGFEFIDYQYGDETFDKTFTYFKDNRNNIYVLKVYLNGNEYEFRCSYKLIPMGVDAIAKSTNQKRKAQYNYDYDKLHYETELNEVDNNEIEYCINDVKVIKEALIKFNDMVGLDKLTLASTAYYDWAYNHKPKWAESMGWLDKQLDYWTNKEYHKWYTGGFCFLNPKYREKVIDGKIYVKDVNSLFPHTMRNMWLVKPLKNPCNNDKCNHPKLLKVYIKYAKIKEGYIPFIYEKGFSRKEPLSEFKNKTFYWTDIDFKLFMCYYDYEVGENYLLEKHCFEWCKGWFDEYIDYWYVLKQNSPKGSWEYLFAKLMLNALYGKFGAKLNRPKKIFTRELPDTKFYKEYGDYYEYTEIIDDEEFISKHEEQGIKLRVRYKPIAIFITARAREYLIKYIQKNRETFIYCDTDSIHSLAPIEVDGKEDEYILGDWKSEGDDFNDGVYYLGGKYLNKKQYILMKKENLLVKVCGLNNKCKEMVNVDNFNYNHLFEKGKTIPKKVKGGVVIKNIDFRIRKK